MSLQATISRKFNSSINLSPTSLVGVAQGALRYDEEFKPIHGNIFIWNGFIYKVIVKDYGVNGKLAWLDRNLGASRVATSQFDTDSYGDLYQWGRLTDGHEKRNSGTTSTLATSDEPGHGNFITSSSSDWRDPRNDNLWQGTEGINNPAPPGWRVPTFDELYMERDSWSTYDRAGAYASVLKIPSISSRTHTGSFTSVHSIYYTSDAYDVLLASKSLNITTSSASLQDVSRAYAGSIRCVRSDVD